jgi:hypothetical protein
MKIAPVISSSVAGPLGILHLPRLWLKIVLHACGRLPEGYRHGAGGFDELLCERLGLDRDALIAYVESEKPDYLALERYVIANARDLSPQTVSAFNNHIRLADMSPENAAKRRRQFDIAGDEFANAVALNDLDDWSTMHAELTHSAPRNATEIQQL